MASALPTLVVEDSQERLVLPDNQLGLTQPTQVSPEELMAQPVEITDSLAAEAERLAEQPDAENNFGLTPEPAKGPEVARAHACGKEG